MKIVIATPILLDKTSPFNHLFKDILEGFLNAGYEIVRIVAVENETDDGYTLGIHSDRISYIKVHRKRMEKANIIKRYVADTLANIKMARLVKRVKADLLFEDVSYSSFWSVRAAKKCEMKIVSMLQDVWPDNAVRSGLIGDGSLIYRYFEMWQRSVYKKSERLICISDDMKEYVASKGIPEEKIDVIYNWGYSDERVDIPWNENEFVKKYGLSNDKFYAAYAGNIGRMQNVELVVGAAELLKDRDDIEFLIIGDGVKREAIEELVVEKQLNNVTMLPMQSSELATSIYSAAGVNIIPLVPGGVKTALPSKTGVVLSCGRPVIFAFGNDCALANTVGQYKAGSCVDAEKPEELAKAIIEWKQKECGKNTGAYSLFEDRFIRTKNVRKYVRSL